MLRWVGDAEDDFDARVERWNAEIVKVSSYVEVKFVVSGDWEVVAKQSFAPAIVVG